ncbi:MAG: hypothetical protein M3N18_07150 [Actinomycetota bacterium]|nr:hypothetical protein [Actinomycetota bacterium]
MSKEVGPTFVPGDPVIYLVRFKCKANVRSVSAVFVAEESGAEVLLEGEVEKKEWARDARLQTALLKQPGEPPEEPKPGTYHLRCLEVHTHSRRTLDFDNPPEGSFRYVEEPADLPVRTEAAWVLPEWHPNSPPGRR